MTQRRQQPKTIFSTKTSLTADHFRVMKTLTDSCAFVSVFVRVRVGGRLEQLEKKNVKKKDYVLLSVRIYKAR